MSLSSIETSVEIWSETDVVDGDESPRNGEGLKGGKESREKKDGWDKDREWWDGPGLKLWDPI